MWRKKKMGGGLGLGLDMGQMEQAEGGQTYMASTHAVSMGDGTQEVSASGMKGVAKEFLLGDLEEQGILGKGACSVVKLAVHTPSGTKVALKPITLSTKTMRDQLRSEMKSVNFVNPNVTRVYNAFLDNQDTTKVVIAVEFMDCGDLEGLIKSRAPMPEPVISMLMRQILLGIQYLNSQKFMHRDLKPANVLINSAGFAKVSDFGISKELQTGILSSSSVGTVAYFSPERAVGKEYGMNADVWAVGCMAHECVTGKCPFLQDDSISNVDVISDICGFEPTLPSNSPEMQDFVSCCLRKDPSQRPGAADMLNHPFIQQHAGVSHTNIAEWLASA